MKFYAVKAGKKVGVFDNWTECNESIKGFPGQFINRFLLKKKRRHSYLIGTFGVKLLNRIFNRDS